MYCLRPGVATSPRSLVEMLRARHERERERVAEERKTREEHLAPESDDLPWEDQAETLLADLEKAREAGNLADARALAARLQVTLAPTLEDLGEFEVDAELADVTVRFRQVSHEALSDHMAALRAAIDTKQPGATIGPQRDFVRLTVAEVAGLQDDDGTYALDMTDEQHLEILHASGLLSLVYVLARDFQQLGPSEKKTFGASRQTPQPRALSLTESAPVAPSGSGKSGVATVELGLPTGDTPSTSTTPAPAGSAFESRGPSTRSSSTTPPTGGWERAG